MVQDVAFLDLVALVVVVAEAWAALLGNLEIGFAPGIVFFFFVFVCFMCMVHENVHGRLHHVIIHIHKFMHARRLRKLRRQF